ncbi:hypothetical protein CFter6_1770 [Collimonas fungivorans]|uniref:Uncharacterized protein n=1 Tax=Collimonas fungivorans TaxID=158899 RepID=A0A127P9H6_9BURK|nr:hypothetical protein CFter6_1770 [Collimonas fungivorans]
MVVSAIASFWIDSTWVMAIDKRENMDVSLQGPILIFLQ